MTLELADRSITHPKGLAEDIYVKVGKFHFPTDFVVVDFEAGPRVPLILRRSFLRIGRALIDVYGEEITLRVDNEAITFNLNQTTRYSSTNDKSVNRIDIIDEVCEEYAPELLGFSNKSLGGNPTPTRSFLRTGRALIDVYGEEITLRVDNEAITFNLHQTTRYSSTNDKLVNRINVINEVCEENAPKLLGFNKSSGGNPTPTSEPLTSEFILEEIEAYLKDDLISLEIDHADCDLKGDIYLIEKLLNNEPFQLPSMDLKQGEIIKEKSSIEEPPELELKDLPSHLEYAYLDKNDKLPVIIAKGLKYDEKEDLLK
ncbi:reverse transcriptase domain-containing protein, partial [Tanacetum coccineum]